MFIRITPNANVSTLLKFNSLRSSATYDVAGLSMISGAIYY